MSEAVVRTWTMGAALQAPLPAASPPAQPAIVQVYREALKPGVEAEYDRIESDTARKCAALRCPHAYLGLESVTGPKEVWWFNGYDSDDDRQRVAEAWARATKALDALGRNSKQKAALVGKGVNVFARHRPDLSAGEGWLIGRGRFLAIEVTQGAPALRGTVFEAEDGTRFVVAAARTREEAEAALPRATDAAAGAQSRVFAVRPAWSHPAADWIAGDPELWRRPR